MRTCAICGADLPENLRHGAMYCPHGRCKTKAYRSRKKETATNEAEQTSRGADLTPEQAHAQVPTRIEATAPSAPLEFSHAVACTCGQQLTIQILISHSHASSQQRGTLSISALATQTDQAENSAKVKSSLPQQSPIAVDATMPTKPNTDVSEPCAWAVPLQNVEQSFIDENTRLAASAEVAPHDVLPAGTPPLDGDEESRTVQSVRLQLSETNSALPPEVAANRVTEPETGAGLRPGPLPTEADPQTYSESPASPSVTKDVSSPSEDLLGMEFLRLAKDRPQEAVEKLHGILDAGRAINDLALVERAYCIMALVYALHGDGARVAERLGHARMAAVRRGNTADVELFVQRIDALISGRNPRQRVHEE